ncbi:MAG: hypothetical protein ACP5M4_14695 [Acidobacteriaceae bacterium]
MEAENRVERWLKAWLAGGCLAMLLVLAPLSAGAAGLRNAASHSHVILKEKMSGGLHGYISMKVAPPPNGYGYGVSFYSTVWPLLARPLKSFQIGLPATWIMPNNLGYNEPLCPLGTLARDEWHKRAPSYRDVFQTIEGGMGFWVSNQFHSTTPKFIMNGTPNCYNYMIETPGWGFGVPPSHLVALKANQMGLVQLSNRLLVPPDGITFERGMDGEVFGAAWMALPLMSAHAAYHRQPTGDHCWTLFVNTKNFKGPVAYWIPDTWSAIARNYPPAAGRTLDIKPGLMAGGAMEVNTVPYFSSKDSKGVLYARVPKLLFPVNRSKTTVLMQDVRMYSRRALYNSVKQWLSSNPAAPQTKVSGAFNLTGAITPTCTNSPLKFDYHGIPMVGFRTFVETTKVGGSNSCAYGLKWNSAAGFPQYFKEEGKEMVAIPASQVPVSTDLPAQKFASPPTGKPYTSPSGPETVWSNPGPRSGPYTAVLSDGSQVTYYWYKFVDQPALQHLHLSKAEKARLQAIAEEIQANWPITRDYMAPPSEGRLATFDSALIVTPPAGMKVGYVPIVTRQQAAPKQGN